MKFGKVYIVAALYTLAVVLSIKCILFILGV